eukprot:gene7572-5339_t
MLTASILQDTFHTEQGTAPLVTFQSLSLSLSLFHLLSARERQERSTGNGLLVLSVVSLAMSLQLLSYM